MKIKLIKPANDGEGVLLANAPRFQDVALPLLAAVTPAHHEVVIVDESFAPDDGGDADVVALSVWTDLALRSYDIAHHYRARGATVVMGGIHPTMCPEEAAAHADVVVRGEAEGLWPQVLRDLEDGTPRPLYDGCNGAPLPDLGTLPHPRRDLYPRCEHRTITPFGIGIEASRGCPYACEFCSVLEVRGHTYRHRPVDDILDEIRGLDHNVLVFVDDNLALDRKRAKEMFRGMIGMGLEWAGEANMSVAEDPELLGLMKASGCRGLMVGFESIQPETIEEMRKLRASRVDAAEAIRRFHDAGLQLMANFVFGFDHETPDVFEQTLDFALGAGVSVAQFRPLVPYPGTPLFARLREEGRLLDDRWWLNYDRPMGDAAPLHYPLQMSPQQLADGLDWICHQFYSRRCSARRLWRLQPWRRTVVENMLFLGINFGFGSRYKSAYRAARRRTARFPSFVRERVGATPPA